jgi:signal transduction histidine kinase
VAVAVTSMVAVAFVIPLGSVVQKLGQERALTDAKQRSAAVAGALRVTADPAAVRRVIADTAGTDAGRVAVHGLAGGAVGTRRAAQSDLTNALRGRRGAVDVEGGRSYLAPATLADGRTVVVEVFIPDEESGRGVVFAWFIVVLLAMALVAVSVWVADRMASKVVGSAKGLAWAAKSLGDGQMGVRVRPSGPLELVEAGQAFNSMADRVQALLRSERELIADLSHRLRTPLTALRLEAEPLAGPAADRVRHSIDSLEMEVDSIIRAARQPPANTGEITRLTAEGLPVAPRCDASEVVRERMVFWGAVAGDQGRVCRRVGASLPAPVAVNREDLVAALDALLGNVFRYTPQGTPIEVAVTRRDGRVAVRVDDGGPGIPNPEAALRRGVSHRGSTGLGLDIVHRLAAGASGAVNIGRSRLGGASVVVLLPDADAPPKPPARMFGFVGRISREPGRRRSHERPR